MTSSAKPYFNAQVLGMILDLHLREDWDMGADSPQELRKRHISILNPMTCFVMEGHARHSIDSREGICDCRERLTQRSLSESRVVGVGTSTSMQKPRLVRFRRHDS